jgi:hypothetical protein
VPKRAVKRKRSRTLLPRAALYRERPRGTVAYRPPFTTACGISPIWVLTPAPSECHKSDDGALVAACAHPRRLPKKDEMLPDNPTD